MNRITKQDINKFGSYNDRTNNFDDDADVNAFIDFLKLVYEDAEFRPKPFGPYDVDLGVYIDDKLILIIDVERWSAWKDTWPSYYSHVSFLGRKEKFLNKPYQFCMVYFNFDRTKFICINKEDIVKYPTVDRNVKGKMDRVKKLSFDVARLYGSHLTNIERGLFKNHFIRKIK